MKIKSFLMLSVVAVATIFTSCSDDKDFNYSIQPTADEIGLTVDTFHLSTKQMGDAPIISKIAADSWVVGSYSNTTWGTTKGELLAQLEPINFSLPSGTFNHVLTMTLTYSGSTHNSSDSIVSLQFYRMDKKTFNYKDTYYSDITPSDYCSESDLLGQKTVKVSSSGTIVDTLSTEITDAFFKEMESNPSTFKSSSAFNNFFNGVYIKVEASTKAIMTVSALTMKFSYSYKASSDTVSYYNTFSANKEVRQVNKIEHSSVPTPEEGYIYVTSPAGEYAEVTLPLSRMQNRLTITSDGSLAYVSKNKKVAVNNALLTFKANDSSDVAYPSYLMLVKKSKLNTFFANSELPDNINAILAAYDSSTDSYSFTLKYLLADAFNKGTFTDETYCLVPVAVTLNSSSYVISVKNETAFTAVKLNSGTNSSNPLRISVVVSGF